MFRWQRLNIITNIIPNRCTLILNVEDSIVCSVVWDFISKNCTSIFKGLVFLSQPVDFHLDLALFLGLNSSPQSIVLGRDPGQKVWPRHNPGIDIIWVHKICQSKLVGMTVE